MLLKGFFEFSAQIVVFKIGLVLLVPGLTLPSMLFFFAVWATCFLPSFLSHCMEYFKLNLVSPPFLNYCRAVKLGFLSKKEVLDKAAKAILTFHWFILDKTLAFLKDML